jgi:hypothetical protein
MAELDIWQEFVAWLKLGRQDELRLSPYYESLRAPLWRFLRSLREKAVPGELEAEPEWRRVGDQVHYLVPLALDGERETYCFTLHLADGDWAFRHIESIVIRLDQTGALPCAQFPDLPEAKKAWIRAEWEVSQNVRWFNFLAAEKGRPAAFDWFKDGAGYALAARTWVPFVSPQRAFILYLCWEQANLHGSRVVLHQLDDRQARLELEPLYFKLYAQTGHLSQQISFDDYRQIYDVTWSDRAAAAGWLLEISEDQGGVFSLYFDR